MTDYYVYRLNANDKEGERQLAFIEEDGLLIFAKEVFKPQEMEFTGIKIVAASVEDAKHVYGHPASDRGEYNICDEPKATTAMRALVNVTQTAHAAVLTILAKRLANINIDLNKTLSLIARAVHSQSNKMMTAEEIYELLKQKWINQFPVEATYYDGRASETGDAGGLPGQDS